DVSVKYSEGTHNWVDENDVEVVEDSFQRQVNDTAREGNSNVDPYKETSAEPQEQVPIPSGDPFVLDALIFNQPKMHDAEVPENVNSEPVFPPGFTPQNSIHEATVMEHVANNSSPIPSHKEASNNVFDEGNNVSKSFNNSHNGSKQDYADSTVRGSNPANGFSILERFQEFINIGQAMGYDMKGSEKDFRKIITSIGEHNVVK
ncbi:hypothetical protein Tco_0935973, partial [Tanacetum coccineum]